jgi:UPF0716 family protein affecting phage T7 exclusion
MTIIATFLILGLIGSLVGLGYLVVLIKESFEKILNDQQVFTKDVMNRLMSSSPEEYAYLSGEKLPQQNDDKSIEETEPSLEEMDFETVKEELNSAKTK